MPRWAWYIFLRSAGLISSEEYAKVEQIFLEKYKPLIGSIYAENHSYLRFMVFD